MICLLFVVDVNHENIAVTEARKLGIPVIGVVDTNSDPDGIDYVIPGNDDSISAIKLYVKSVADACIEGNSSRSDTQEAKKMSTKEAKPAVVVKASEEAPVEEAPVEEAQTEEVLAEETTEVAAAPIEEVKAEEPAE